MDTSIFPIRYSQLSPDALQREVIKRYNIGNQIECKYYRMGMNDVYLLNTESGTYYLRVSQANVHKRNDYEEEALIIDTLYQNNIGVAYPIKCKDNRFVWSILAPEGERYIILFSEAKNQPSQDGVKHLYNLGAMIARMHMVADENNFKVSRPPIDLIQLIDNPIKSIKRHFYNRKGDYKYLSESMNKLSHFISDCLPTSKPFYGFCHGDIQPSNINVNGEQPVLFDFDCMGYGWRSHDIAVFLFNNSLENDKYRESKQWESFLDGYNSIRPLEENEIRAIPAFCALRNTWVIGVHTQLSERILGCQMFNDGYLNFFLNNFKMWFNITFS